MPPIKSIIISNYTQTFFNNKIQEWYNNPSIEIVDIKFSTSTSWGSGTEYYALILYREKKVVY